MNNKAAVVKQKLEILSTNNFALKSINKKEFCSSSFFFFYMNHKNIQHRIFTLHNTQKKNPKHPKAELIAATPRVTIII